MRHTASLQMPKAKAARDGPRPLHVPVSEWVHVAVSRDWVGESLRSIVRTLRMAAPVAQVYPEPARLRRAPERLSHFVPPIRIPCDLTYLTGSPPSRRERRCRQECRV